MGMEFGVRLEVVVAVVFPTINPLVLTNVPELPLEKTGVGPLRAVSVLSAAN
jgi:hypothetical protein